MAIAGKPAKTAPWIMRNVSSAPKEGAKAIAIDKMATAIIEKVIKFFRPHASETEPTINIQIASATVVKESEREAVAGEILNVSAIMGRTGCVM